MVNIYITTWATTKGIIRAELQDWPIEGSAGEIYLILNGFGGVQTIRRNDWHPTMMGAERRACRLREREIGNLEGRIRRLNAMTFGECTAVLADDAGAP